MLSFLLVWNPYIALPIAGGVLLVVLVWWIAVKVARHRHDKLLEKQVQEEADRLYRENSGTKEKDEKKQFDPELNEAVNIAADLV